MFGDSRVQVGSFAACSSGKCYLDRFELNTILKKELSSCTEACQNDASLENLENSGTSCFYYCLNYNRSDVYVGFRPQHFSLLSES